MLFLQTCVLSQREKTSALTLHFGYHRCKGFLGFAMKWSALWTWEFASKNRKRKISWYSWSTFSCRIWTQITKILLGLQSKYIWFQLFCNYEFEHLSQVFYAIADWSNGLQFSALVVVLCNGSFLAVSAVKWLESVPDHDFSMNTMHSSTF